MKTTGLTHIYSILILFLASTLSSQALYSVGPLTKEEASKSGITIKSRPNGEEGTKVWIEIEKDGPLGDFSWIELRMKNEHGEHFLSTRLHPITRDQTNNIITVSFSVDPSQLDSCSFWLCTGSPVFNGVIHTIKVSDYVDVPEEPSL